ncbi:response regulator [Erwiniaceae bacterium L1_54_6]|nr:response regulator [Pantoea cypripedii]MDF7659414.1 response regulator [Erwiniaceae bacterium L1_54_6]
MIYTILVVATGLFFYSSLQCWRLYRQRHMRHLRGR